MLFDAVDAVLVASTVDLPCLPLHPLLLLSGVAGLQHLQLLVSWKTRAAFLLPCQLELSPLERLSLYLSNQRLCQSVASVLLTEKELRGSSVEQEVLQEDLLHMWERQEHSVRQDLLAVLYCEYRGGSDSHSSLLDDTEWGR